MAEPLILSHWSTLIDGLDTQYASDFYEKLETRLKLRNVLGMKFRRVQHATGAVLTGRREYLRIEYREHVFDVCAAPFGSGFFVSWWLVNYPGCLTALAEIPILGLPIRIFITRLTYYRIDTMDMFRSLVHGVVREMIEEICEIGGHRVPTDIEFKPAMKEFFAR